MMDVRLLLLSDRLSTMGITSKQRIDRHGRVTGDKAFFRARNLCQQHVVFH